MGRRKKREVERKTVCTREIKKQLATLMVAITYCTQLPEGKLFP